MRVSYLEIIVNARHHPSPGTGMAGRVGWFEIIDRRFAMTFVVIVKFRLSLPYEHWVAQFDAHDAARRTTGVETLFRYPVIGEQSAVYGVRTERPRTVHDTIYDPAIRDMIEASGFIVGSEEIILCEADV